MNRTPSVDNWPGTFLPTMGALTADEQQAIELAVGVLAAHAGDGRLDEQVRDTFAERAGSLQQLLRRAKL